MSSMRLMILCSLFVLGACNSEVYLRDGVTDGDTFYLPGRAFVDDDPVLQSWIAYSLSRSACQLEIGGDNPARAHSFDCEVRSRQLLLDTWKEKRNDDATLVDSYFDELAAVADAGFLHEYVARFHSKRDWETPEFLNEDAFNGWRRENLRRHKPQTRIVGSWNYARNVTSQ